MKCFKHCSVAKRLPCILSTFFNFWHVNFPELRISRKEAYLKASKSHQKQGIDLQPFQVFKRMKSAFYFGLGIGNSVERFHSKFIVPSRAWKNIPFL